jgi:unconventional SNARE in the endoplasmic reticulum protein 1
MMADYSKRVGFLKGLRMADQLVRIYSHIIYLTSKTYLYQSLQPTVPEKVAAAQMLPHSSTSEGSDIATEIQQKTRSKYNNELRDQLFQLDKGSVIFLQLKSVIYNLKRAADGVRQRAARQSSTGDDLDALVKYHHSMQEKIADDMLSLTKNLKEQTLLASNIITKDIKVS